MVGAAAAGGVAAEAAALVVRPDKARRAHRAASPGRFQRYQVVKAFRWHQPDKAVRAPRAINPDSGAGDVAGASEHF